jgi:TRAP-type C4-dicarboxylate transport system permease small subunit
LREDVKRPARLDKAQRAPVRFGALTRLHWLVALPRIAVTVLMLVAMTDMLAGVFLRYVMTWLTATLGLPRVDFFWVEEVGEYALAWLTFIGAAIGIQRGTHFAVHLVIERFPPALRRWIFTVHYLTIAGFGAVVAVFGWQVAELNSQSFSPALNLNLRWIYLSAVVGGALMIAYSLAALREAWRGRPPGLTSPEAV